MAVAVNVMGSDSNPNVTRAYIENSTVTMDNGTLEISALNENPTMDPRIIAVTGSLGIGGGPSSVAGAGTISVNIISNDTEAYAKNSTIEEKETLSSPGTMDTLVKARDNSGIVAIGGAVGLSRKVSLGAAAGYSEIDNDVMAYLEDVQLTTSGTLTVDAQSDSEIEATTVGVAAATLSGVGSGSGSYIDNLVEAHITGGAVTTTGGSVKLTATDSSKITADAGGFAAALNYGGEQTEAALAVGISIANNEIANEIKAYMEDATVTTDDVELTGESTATIDGWSIAGAAAAGGSSQGSGLAGAGAGAVSHNEITNVIEAYITDGGFVTANDGDVRVTATDSSKIMADAGGFALAVGGGKSFGGALSVGASRADNDVANHIRAYLGYSTASDSLDPEPISVSAAGDVVLNATSAAVIDALTIGVAIAAAGSAQGLGLAGSGAGAAAYNEITNNVEAFVKGAGEFATTRGDLELTATDESEIIARAYGWAIAVGASLSSVGGTRTVGISIAENEIGNTVDAYIDNTGLTQNRLSLLNGGVRLNADSTSTIEARSVAASIAVAAGKSGGLALSGGGAVSTNAIGTDTNAYLKGVDLDSNGDVALQATNTSVIVANIDAWSVSAGFGAEVGGAAASVGASVAGNYVGYDLEDNRAPAQVRAYVENSSIDAQGVVTLTAVANETIDAGVAAGAVAVAGSVKGGAFGRSGSGADAKNKIATQVKAYIDGDGQSGIAADSVILTADDTSNITADVAAVAVAASFAPKGAASLAIGVSLAKNQIYNEVEAYVTNADDMDARHGPVKLEAIENATIDATSVAVAVSVSVSQMGLALSGAGANATNMIGNRVHAYIADSSVTAVSSHDYTTQNWPDQLLQGDRVKLDNGDIFQYIGTDPLAGPVDLSVQDYTDDTLWTLNDVGSIIVTADSTSSITAKVDAVSASVAVGATSVAGSVGVTIAKNLIGVETSYPNEVLAHIDNSTVTSARDTRVNATSAETIESESVAASIAVAAGGFGAAGAGAGTGTWNLFGTKVYAYLNNTDAVASGDVDVTAVSSSEVTKSSALGTAIALSLAPKGIAISVAASTVENTIGNDVQAYVLAEEAETRIDAGGNMSILAESSSAVLEVSAVTASVSASVGGLAFSGGGIDMDNTVENTVDARIEGPVSVAAGGDVSVLAGEDAYLVGDATAVSIAAGLGAAIGVALVENNINSTIQARVDEANVTSQKTQIHADSVADVAKTISAGVSASAVGAQGNRADANIRTLVKASTSGATLISTEDVTVKATADNAARAVTKGGAFGAVAVGAMIADVNLGRSDDIYEVEATVGADTTVRAQTLWITAISTDDLLSESIAGGGGAVAAAGAESKVTSNNANLARIGADADIDVDALVVNSTHVQDIDASADSYALALAAGSGAGVYNTITSKANVDIGAGADVTARNIVISAKNQLSKDQYETNLRSGSASLGNVNILISQTEIGDSNHPFEAVVDVGSGAKITVEGDNKAPGIFKIEALNDVSAVDAVLVESVSGFGISTGISTVRGNTRAKINVNGATLESKAGDVYLTAKTDSSINPSANLLVLALGGGGGGAKATAETTATNAIQVENANIKGSDVYLYAGRDSTQEPNLIDTFADAQVTTVSMQVAAAVPVPTANITETNTLEISGNSSVRALEDVNLVADGGGGVGEGRRRAEGFSMSSIGLVPVPIPFTGFGDDVSINSVVVDSSASIEAGINSQAVMLIKPVTLQGIENIGPGRLDMQADDRLLSEGEKLNEGVSFVLVEPGDIVKVIAGANQGGIAGHWYSFEGKAAELVLSKQDYSDAQNWTDVTTTEPEANVAYQSDFVTDVEYEYCALDVAEISFDVFTGTVIEVAADAHGDPVAGDGEAEVGGLYRYKAEILDPVQIVLHTEDYGDSDRWERIEPDYTLPLGNSVEVGNGRIVRTEDSALYQYLGGSGTSIDLDNEDFTIIENWAELTPTIHRSDMAVSFKEKLENKFYVVKPTRLDKPTMSLQNVGSLVLVQRDQNP